MNPNPATDNPLESDPSEAELRKRSEDLKAKIAEAKARNDMPVDSSLGNPKWDRKAADGHLDLPPDDDEN
jgi:hypothetical protein